MTVAALSEYRLYTQRLLTLFARLGLVIALTLTTAIAEPEGPDAPEADAPESTQDPEPGTGPTAPLSADNPGEDTALEKFVALVDARDWPNARVMANEIRDRFEGTPGFDLYYARLLIQEGRAQEAIFALERVLAFAPGRHRVRLDLARAYFINNNMERSRTEFERVRATNPPANVRANINEFLSRIDAAQRAQIQQFQMFAGLDVGYDTNINGGSTLDERLAPNLLGLTDLSESSKAIDSSFGRFRLGSTWVRPAHLRAANIFSLQGFTTLYPGNSGFNQLGLNSQWRYQSNADQSRQALAINAGQLWLDNSPWQLSLNLSGEVTYPVRDPVWLGPIASTSLTFAQQDNRSNSVRDALGLVATVQDAPRRHRLTSQYIQYNRSGTDNGYSEWRGLSHRYQLDWRWPNRLASTLALEHQWHHYEADDRLFVEPGTFDARRRSDQRLTVDASLTWLPEPWLTSRSGLRYDWLDSNINAYSRDQWLISQSVTLTF